MLTMIMGMLAIYSISLFKDMASDWKVQKEVKGVWRFPTPIYYPMYDENGSVISIDMQDMLDEMDNEIFLMQAERACNKIDAILYSMEGWIQPANDEGAELVNDAMAFELMVCMAEQEAMKGLQARRPSFRIAA